MLLWERIITATHTVGYNSLLCVNLDNHFAHSTKHIKRGVLYLAFRTPPHIKYKNALFQQSSPPEWKLVPRPPFSCPELVIARP